MAMTQHRARLLSTAAAAVVLSYAMPAHALIATSLNNYQSATPGSEITLYVWDTTTKNSYIRDLGNLWYPSSVAAVSSVFSSSQSISGDANWANFLSINGGVTSTTEWGIFSSFKAGSVAGQLATNTVNNPVVTPYGSSQWGSLDTAWRTANNGDNLVADTIADNDSAVQNSNIYPFASWAGGFNSNVNQFNAFLASESTLAFYSLVKTSSTVETVTQLAGTWTLNSANGNLSYDVPSAVPLPGSAPLMAAGLLALGAFVARRRAGQ